MAEGNRPFRSMVTLKTLLVAGAALISGFVLLYFGGRDDLWKHHAGMQAFVNGLGGLFIVSLGLGLFWELIGRRSFAREVLESARTSVDVSVAGLVQMGSNYVEVPDWADLFAGVQKLDIFVAYGRTWRSIHLHRLEGLARQRDARIRVYLPDPEDEATMSWISARFSMTAQDLVNAINEARLAYQAMAVPGGASVSVFYRPGDPVFSCYRFDSRAVLTLYSHKGRTGVPTLVCRAGGDPIRLHSRRAAGDRRAESSGTGYMSGRSNAQTSIRASRE